MIRYYLLYSFLISSIILQAQQPILPIYKENQSYDYAAVRAAYQAIAEAYPAQTHLEEMGLSDQGRPIDFFILSEEGLQTAAAAKASGKLIVWINNGIHPGEPCGIDASLELVQNILRRPKQRAWLKEIVLCVVPIYNVGGAHQRSCCSRAAQNGPLAYGFRGNAQHLDLNRDFIKCDSRNAQAFNRYYSLWQPDFFVDTHTTNGSDHQYTLTLIAGQADKMQSLQAAYQEEELLPALYAGMKKRKKEMIPYVYTMGPTPEDGIKGFLETPRYSSGYANLFQSWAFITEALKYKPYAERVEHSLAFLEELLAYGAAHRLKLQQVRAKARAAVLAQDSFCLRWALDTSRAEKLVFKGYETEMQPSPFGENEQRLVYRKDRPYSKVIPYYPHYKEEVVVKAPRAYIVPQSQWRLLDRLRWNGVEMRPLEADTSIAVEAYYIRDLQTVKQAYEGHYLHQSVAVEKVYMPMQFYKGDYVVSCGQPLKRYLVETLEPQGHDAFFAWNFFDAILQQKEWFSPFSFESIALELLENDPYLKAAFEAKKKEEEAFAKSRYQQLYFIYQHSPYYEPSHRLYPIARLP